MRKNENIYTLITLKIYTFLSEVIFCHSFAKSDQPEPDPQKSKLNRKSTRNLSNSIQPDMQKK